MVQIRTKAQETSKNSEKRLYGIDKNYESYDFGPYTFTEVYAIAEEYRSKNLNDRFSIEMYNDMRDRLPAIERMLTPFVDVDGNLCFPDSTPFNQGDLTDY